MRRYALALVAMLAGVAGAGCSGDDRGGGSRQVLRVDLIAPAVTAVQERLGGPQRFFEVNAAPTLVNLFVANDAATTATVYVFDVSGLSEPTPPRGASGATFGAGDINFDGSTVLAPALAQLPDALPVTFAIVGAEGGGVQYRVNLASRAGGALSVVVTRDGTVLGVDAT